MELRDPDYSVEMSGRLTKLENAISKQRTIKFRYWTITRDEEAERTVNPYALLPEAGSWYLIGLDLEKEGIRTFRVSRIRGDIRFATRRERDFRAPEDFDPSGLRGRQAWQFGDIKGEAEIELDPDTSWWVERTIGKGHVEDDVFRTDYCGSQAARDVDPQAGRPRAPARAARARRRDRALARGRRHGPRGKAAARLQGSRSG